MRELAYFLEDHSDVCVRIEARCEDSEGEANVDITMTKWYSSSFWRDSDNITVTKSFNLDKLKYRLDDALDAMYEKIEEIEERKGY